MKARLSPLLPELIRQSDEACERIAATCLKPDVVREKIFEAAKLGLRQLRIRLPDGVNVRTCEATKAFEAWARQTGLRVTWENRSCAMPDGRMSEVWEPEMLW